MATVRDDDRIDGGAGHLSLYDAFHHTFVGDWSVPSSCSNRCFTPPVCEGQHELLVRCSASVQHLAVSPAIRLGLRSARGGPTMPSADSSPGIREAYAALSPFPWHATSQGTGEASRGKLSYRPCIDAGFIKHSPLWMEDFTVACPLVPTVPHLISGSCPSLRTFVPRFLQTPPHGDALALPLSFGSTYTWTGDFHSRA